MYKALVSRLAPYRGSYTVLFFTLLAVMVLYPFTFIAPVRILLNFAVLFVMFAALAECWMTRPMFILGCLLALGSVTGTVGTEVGYAQAEPFKIGLRLAFYGLFCFNIFSSILRGRKATLNTVLGASAVYLLMALIWADLYHLLQFAFPGSFNLGPAEAIEPFGVMTEEARLMYFSIVTMTTVGYGDMSPLTPPARMLAGLQGLVAQLYIAIIIGRLIGMELSHRKTDPSR